MPTSIGCEDEKMATTGKAADAANGMETGSAAGCGADAAARPRSAPAPDDTDENELAELEDRWRRAVADLENLRKRYAKELVRERAAERAKVAASWLQVLDNLERALDHAATDAGPLAQGVRAIRDQAVEVLARLGYPRQDETGVPFDPNRHEVVTLVDEPDQPPGTVVRVLRPGYGEHDAQLRPMAVAVNKPRE
jgi:molecular chaperone GrpE